MLYHCASSCISLFVLGALCSFNLPSHTLHNFLSVAAELFYHRPNSSLLAAPKMYRRLLRTPSKIREPTNEPPCEPKPKRNETASRWKTSPPGGRNRTTKRFALNGWCSLRTAGATWRNRAWNYCRLTYVLVVLAISCFSLLRLLKIFWKSIEQIRRIIHVCNNLLLFSSFSVLFLLIILHFGCSLV